MTEDARFQAWVDGVERMRVLRDSERSAAEEMEYRTLWRKYTPQEPPKMPRTYRDAVERVTAIHDRIKRGGLSDVVYNRLQWNIADLVSEIMDKVESGVWQDPDAKITIEALSHWSGDGATRVNRYDG